MKILSRILGEVLCLPVRAYRLLISPWKPRTCRYEPTCSRYFLEAVKLRGPLVGSILGILRILRCHPFGGCGYDPVPRKGWRYREPEDEEGAEAGREGSIPGEERLRAAGGEGSRSKT